MELISTRKGLVLLVLRSSNQDIYGGAADDDDDDKEGKEGVHREVREFGERTTGEDLHPATLRYHALMLVHPWR
ncbi:hypothetical protein QJS04_geneDACA013621 [Acorus gramineus]|uniref:Uncharacterized protein n=1 Tax=Acorus gramineus TaxID=55184 RepID=A0AAV9AIR5_ACOGR|nr:hypothetical protein QJS04_geneDACA013621 [Acorus gramineus]